MSFPHSTIWFLFRKNETAFVTVKQLYEPSFARDPRLLKLVSNSAKSIFNVTDQRSQSQGIMPMLLNAFMQPTPPQSSSTSGRSQSQREFQEHLDFD